MKKIILFISGWFQKMIAAHKQRFIIICTAVFAVILSLSVFLSLRNSSDDEPALPAGRISINSPIASEDLFLPEEPDFLPGVILERDRRQFWTEDDALEFWQDPLRFGEEQWRVNIETAVNELMERVP